MVLLLISLIAFSDEIRADVDRAKLEYSEKLENAHQHLLKAFDDEIKEVAKSGNLDLVKSLTKEKDDYLAYFALPASRRMTKAKTDYENCIRGARIELTAAYNKARTEYTKNLDLKNAEIYDQELKDFLEKDKNKNLNADLVKSHTEWSGTYRVTSPRGVTKSDVTIFIRKREQDEIEYEQWGDNHSRGLLFRGKLNGGSLKARCVEILKGKFSDDTIGAMNTGSFMGKRFVRESFDNAAKTYKVMELFLVEEEK